MIVLNSRRPSPSFRAALACIAFASLSSACSGGVREEVDRGRNASEPASVENRRAVLEKETSTTAPQRVPSDGAPVSQNTGEVPPQLLAIFQDDLARRALVKHETITVLSATEQQWPNGALGCPQPGRMYTQAIVPGYRVVLQAAGERYAYHSDLRGNFVVCSAGLSFPPVKDQAKNPAPAE